MPLGQGSTVKEGILVEFGSQMAPLLRGINIGKLAVGGFVSYGVAELAKFQSAATEVERKWSKAMAEIRTIADVTRPQLAAMRRDVADLSKEFGQNFEDVARARYDVISAGFTKIADSAEVMRAAATGATGGLTDIATAAGATTTVLNAYKLGADQAMRVNDLLFTTVRQGVTTYGELAANIGDVASTARAARIPMEELMALIAAVTRGMGKGSTPEAITAINQFLLAFVKVGPEARAVMDEVGISLNDGILPVMEKIALLADKDLESLAKLFPSVRALKAALVAGADTTTLADILEQMGESGGAAQRAADIMSEELDMIERKIKAQGEAIKASWGQSTVDQVIAIKRAWLDVLGVVEQVASTGTTLLGLVPGMGGYGPQRRPLAPWQYPEALLRGERAEPAGQGGYSGPFLSPPRDRSGMLPFGGGWTPPPPLPVVTPDTTDPMGRYRDLIARRLQYADEEMIGYAYAGIRPFAGGDLIGRSRDEAIGLASRGMLGSSSRESRWVSSMQIDMDEGRLGREREEAMDRRFREARRKMMMLDQIGSTVFTNMSQLIEGGIYNGLVQAFGAGESALGRFAAATLAQIATIIAQTLVLRGLMQTLFPGSSIFGFEHGGYTGGSLPGYAWGGYTSAGIPGYGRVAGVVHENEFVLNERATRAAGIENLERLNRAGDSISFGDINISLGGTRDANARDLADDIAQALPYSLRQTMRSGTIRKALPPGKRTL